MPNSYKAISVIVVIVLVVIAAAVTLLIILNKNDDPLTSSSKTTTTSSLTTRRLTTTQPTTTQLLKHKKCKNLDDLSNKKAITESFIELYLDQGGSLDLPATIPEQTKTVRAAGETEKNDPTTSGPNVLTDQILMACVNPEDSDCRKISLQCKGYDWTVTHIEKSDGCQECEPLL